MNILLVEDEPEVAAFIKKGLEEHGYYVTTVHDGMEGCLDRIAGEFR